MELICGLLSTVYPTLGVDSLMGKLLRGFMLRLLWVVRTNPRLAVIPPLLGDDKGTVFVDEYMQENS